MRHEFYDSVSYRSKQAANTSRSQKLGIYEHLKKRLIRTCARIGCGTSFEVVSHDPKRFCSKSCSAKVTNVLKGKRSEATKNKIAETLRVKGIRPRGSPAKGEIRVQRKELTCSYKECRTSFIVERWRNVKFCSNKCAMRVVGGKPTSPKASRGKAGIRVDVDPTIYFYSRWEANIARLYNYLHIRWKFSHKTFDLKGQRYTPDFYLPDQKLYIEVKNFWGEYSKTRDEKFRKYYPNIKLRVILKEEYLALQEKYSSYIPKWEYNNSPFTQGQSS